MRFLENEDCSILLNLLFIKCFDLSQLLCDELKINYFNFFIQINKNTKT